ncbi:hypothetical protein [Streptomyces sp. NPDC006335]|uniref:hypothetical protein n=1 Tax=Streptomyces sp. NPDC006335 TaxID=3156895 RepID=UPI0033BA777D
MTTTKPVIIYPPAEDGGRRVRVDDRFVGLAYGLLDVVEFLRLAGLDDVDDVWVQQSALIEWRGDGAQDLPPKPNELGPVGKVGSETPGYGAG